MIPVATNKTDIEGMDRVKLAEFIKGVNSQIEMQKIKVNTLKKKIEEEYEGCQIAEMDSAIQDIKYYRAKLEKEALVERQMKSAIQSQSRLIAKGLN